MGTKFTLRKSDGSNQIFEPLVLKGSKLEMLALYLDHLLMLRTLRICIMHAYLIIDVLYS